MPEDSIPEGVLSEARRIAQVIKIKELEHRNASLQLKLLLVDYLHRLGYDDGNINLETGVVTPISQPSQFE